MSHALPRSASMATWEDLKAYEEGTHVEIIEGEIIVAPRPLPAHNRVQRKLSALIGGPYDDALEDDDPAGWWILLEVDLQLDAHTVVIPDMVGWRREAVPTFPQRRPITQVPDWVCEVLSPSNTSYDRIVKADLYLKAGVAFLWLVDPSERTLECYQASEKGWLRLGAWGEDDAPRVEPFGEVALPLGRIFPPRPAPEAEAEGGDAPR